MTVKHSSSNHKGSLPKPSSGWQQPLVYDPQNLGDLHNLRTLCAQVNPEWINPARSISDSVFEFNCPDKIEHEAAFTAFFAQSGLECFADLGAFIEADRPSTAKISTRIVYVPWTNQLIHYPAETLYHQLRTFRYRDLLTASELDQLRNNRVAVIGQSVGGNLAFSLIQNGIGNAVLLCDQKGPTISNFGRANMAMTDLGLSKVHATAKRISIMDPYVSQTHMFNGITASNVKELARFAPDIIVDEVDDMRTSAYLRILARKLRKPYISVSDVHDNAVLEICRHDQDSRTKLYASKVPDSTARDLIEGKLNAHQQEQIFIKSIGIRQLTPKMIQSGLAIGETLAGIPQLGTTASASASLATVAIRNIILGRGPSTGIYATNLAPGSAKPGAVEWGKALVRFWKYSRQG